MGKTIPFWLGETKTHVKRDRKYGGGIVKNYGGGFISEYYFLKQKNLGGGLKHFDLYSGLLGK